MRQARAQAIRGDGDSTLREAEAGIQREERRTSITRRWLGLAGSMKTRRLVLVACAYCVTIVALFPRERSGRATTYHGQAGPALAIRHDETGSDNGCMGPSPAAMQWLLNGTVNEYVPVCDTRPGCVEPRFPNPQRVNCDVSGRAWSSAARGGGRGVSSSGVWMLPRGFRYKFDQAFADAILDLVSGCGSLLELGAGLGCYTYYFRDSGRFSRVSAFEGATNVEALTGGLVSRADLTERRDFGGAFDWVVCLEVAEHIPPQHEETFLENLVSSSPGGIVLSWGLPGQGGVGHVNLRPREYVVDAMKARGYRYDEGQSERLRGRARFDWFKQTPMVFYTELAQG